MPSKKQLLVILGVSLIGGAVVKMALRRFAPSIAAYL